MKTIIELYELTPIEEARWAGMIAKLSSVYPGYISFWYDVCRISAGNVAAVTPNQSIAATDCDRRIWLDLREMIRRQMTVDEMIFVLVHEIQHVQLRHVQRVRAYLKTGNIRGLEVQPDLANQAQDFLINGSLVADGLKMPTSVPGLIDRKYGQDLLWEDVYVQLYEQQQKQGGGGKGKPPPQSGQQPGKGKGQGKGQPGENFDHHFDPNDVGDNGQDGQGEQPMPAMSEQQIDMANAQAAEVGKAQGKSPGSINRLVREITDPKLDWRDILQETVAHVVRSGGSLNYDRPNRHRLVLDPMTIVPSVVGRIVGTVAVAVDTSGSVGEREFKLVNGALADLFNEMQPDRVIYLECDAQVQRVAEIESYDDFNELVHKGFKGGGGTDFKPVFKQIERGHSDFDFCEDDIQVLVYLTDMYGDFPDQAPPYPVVWISTSKGVTAPFGRVVEIGD